MLFHSYLSTFPKTSRYSIGGKIEAIILEILELLYIANAKTSQERIGLCKEIDIKLKILKLLVRLSFDSKAINQKKYIALQEYLQEIGRMLGGWLKQTQQSFPIK